MSRPERQQNVLELLKGLRGIEPLKQLFWSELNYQRVNQPLLDDIERQKRVEQLRTDLERISQARAALRTVQDVPFVWDIAFVEIFQDEKDGFDIVIGNPPYVRQENISDPRLARGEVTTENKKSTRRNSHARCIRHSPDSSVTRRRATLPHTSSMPRATSIFTSISTDCHC